MSVLILYLFIIFLEDENFYVSVYVVISSDLNRMLRELRDGGVIVFDEWVFEIGERLYLGINLNNVSK